MLAAARRVAAQTSSLQALKDALEGSAPVRKACIHKVRTCLLVVHTCLTPADLIVAVCAAAGVQGHRCNACRLCSLLSSALRLPLCPGVFSHISLLADNKCRLAGEARACFRLCPDAAHRARRADIWGIYQTWRWNNVRIKIDIVEIRACSSARCQELLPCWLTPWLRDLQLPTLRAQRSW